MADILGAAMNPIDNRSLKYRIMWLPKMWQQP